MNNTECYKDGYKNGYANCFNELVDIMKIAVKLELTSSQAWELTIDKMNKMKDKYNKIEEK